MTSTRCMKFLLRHLTRCLLLGLFFLLSSLLSGLDGATLPPPNVILVVADDLGWNDVSWHNPDMLTPHLDKYAKSGVILEQSYVCPLCSPTRASIMTGYYPYHMGLQHDVIHPLNKQYVPLDKSLLPQYLKMKNYTSHLVGKWHLGCCKWQATPMFRGFDSFFGYHNGAEDYYTHSRGGGFDFRFNSSVYHGVDNEYSTVSFAARAEDIIRSHDQTNPLFLYLAFQAVHSPLQVPLQYKEMYPNIKNKERKTFCGMVTAMDEAFGQVTRALEETGMADNMLLIFTTDNGGPHFNGANNWPLRGSKRTLWEGGTRGVAFAYSKNLIQQPCVNHEMIHAVDWFPTILDAAGVNIGQNAFETDGVSQLATITSGAASSRNQFVYNIDELTGRSAIRVEDYKLIKGGAGEFNYWYYPPELVDGRDLPSNSSLAFTKDSFMLFNVKEDPSELQDLSESHPDELERLKRHLEHMTDSLVPTQDPDFDFGARPSLFGGNWSPGWC